MKSCARRQKVVPLLAAREYNHRNSLRTNLRILSILVCGDSFEFRKVWEKDSKSPIEYAGTTVFMDNYQTAYDGYGTRWGAPVRMFQMKDKLSDKIVDAILSQSEVADIMSSPTGRPGQKLYAVTNYSLLVIDFKTGQVLLKADLFNLSSPFHLKSIYWCEAEESLVLSSTKHSVQTSDVVMVLALFSILPLRFLCMTEITRQVFGRHVNNASLREGILFVMHQNNILQLYSIRELLEQHQVTPQLVDHSTQLGINLKITERPICLLEIRALGCNVVFGANPWHYIMSASKITAQVHCLETGDLVENGVLVQEDPTLEQPATQVLFHEDSSNRVIDVLKDEIRIFLLQEVDGKRVMTLDFSIPVKDHVLPASKAEFPEVTASGRPVKRRFGLKTLMESEFIIDRVSYDDELEVLIVKSGLTTYERQTDTVCLYHNATGRLLKTIPLGECVYYSMDEGMMMDRDTIMRVTKWSGKARVEVFRLVEKCAPRTDPHQTQSRPRPQASGRRRRQEDDWPLPQSVRSSSTQPTTQRGRRRPRQRGQPQQR